MPNKHPLAHILIAIAEGKTVQWSHTGSPTLWYDLAVDASRALAVYDAFNWRIKPEKQKAFIVVFAKGTCMRFDRKDEAVVYVNQLPAAAPPVQAIIEIAYEEGEGL